MHPRPRRPTRPLARLLVLWVLAIVLPLQSTAVGVFGALGPAHLHRQVDRPLVLEDVRRWKLPAAAPTHVLTAFGHFHAHASPLRHHHRSDDDSVVRLPGDAADADESADIPALSALALPSSPCPWTLPEPVAIARAQPATPAPTRSIEPPERPPRPV